MRTIYTITQLREILGAFAEEYGVERVYLFGSYADGCATEESDIDIRIDKGKIRTLFTLSDFMLNLEDKLKVPVDVVTTDSLDPAFLEEISKNEVLIYEEQGHYNY